MFELSGLKLRSSIKHKTFLKQTQETEEFVRNKESSNEAAFKLANESVKP